MHMQTAEETITAFTEKNDKMLRNHRTLLEKNLRYKDKLGLEILKKRREFLWLGLEDLNTNSFSCLNWILPKTVSKPPGSPQHIYKCFSIQPPNNWFADKTHSPSITNTSQNILKCKCTKASSHEHWECCNKGITGQPFTRDPTLAFIAIQNKISEYLQERKFCQNGKSNTTALF